jgi:predicted Zn-dependent peptidase
MKNTFKLKNGIKCLLYNQKCFNIVSILILVKTGSINEPLKFRGISHFLEHMFFKGTHKRLTQIDIAHIIDKYGGILNAYTDKEHTGYYIKINKNYFDEAFDVITDMLTNSLFLPKDLETEKKVVLNEMRQRLSNPSYQNNVKFYEMIFKNNKLGKRVIGHPSDIKSFNRNLLLAYLTQFYKPENMTLVVVGDININNTKNLIINSLQNYTIENYDINIKDKYSKNISKYNEYQKLLKRDLTRKNNKIKWKYNYHMELNTKLQHIFVMIGFPGFTYHNKNQYVVDFINAYLTSGMSSVLFDKVRNQQGLVYGISSNHKTFNNAGVLIINFSVKEIKNLLEAIHIILVECHHLKTKLLPDETIQKLKTHLTSKLSFITNDSYAFAEFLGLQYMNHPNTLHTPNELTKIYDKTTEKDILKICQQIFDFSKIQISIISHSKINEADIKKVIDNVENIHNTIKKNTNITKKNTNITKKNLRKSEQKTTLKID